MSRFMPIASWLPNYQKSWLLSDFMSGANVWAVLIPTALAYSNLVGVNPIVGLYCVPAALFAYAIFGSSRLLVVGPDASVAVLAGATLVAVGSVGPVDPLLAASLAVMVGLIYLAFYALRLGWISDLVPDPVLKGMIEGIVWTTILKQSIDLLGIEIEGDHKRFFPKLFEVLKHVPETHPQTFAVGAGCLVALILLHRFAHQLPSALIMLAGAIATVSALRLDELGVKVLGKSSSSAVSVEFANMPSLEQLAALLPGALSIVVIGFTLSIAAAKRAAEKTGENIDPNEELLAIGASNIGAGLSGGYAVTGTLSKTAVAMSSGGKTQIGNVFTGLLGILTIMLLIPVFAPLADAALAALVVFVMLELSDLRYIFSLWRIRRTEFVVALISFAGVLAYGPLGGVVIGAGLALAMLAEHISRPPTAILGRTTAGNFSSVAEASDAKEIPGLFIWRMYGPLVFLNARRLSNSITSHLGERPSTKVVLLDASATTGADTTGTIAYMKLRDELADKGIELWVAGARDEMWSRIVASLLESNADVPKRFASVREAFEAYKSHSS